MADNSNMYSISGLSRNKTLSGLHAHRPDNASIYFDYKQIKISPQFISILEADVVGVGYNYSKNTTITFPQPEHPRGIPASGYPLFTLSNSSFTVTNPGSNYSTYDKFPIIFENNPIGFFIVTETGVNGSISDYNVFASSNMTMTSQSSLPVVDLRSNLSASITSNDKFTIADVNLTYVGMGYQTINRNNGSPINHDPIISNAGSNSPSGLIVKSSINPYIAKNSFLDNRRRPAQENKFEQIQIDQYLTQYILITNYSLGDFIS